MSSKHLITIAILVGVCLGVLVFYVGRERQGVQGENATWQPRELSFETISHETYGRYENHEYLVIENSGEWEKVWLLAWGSEAYPIPEVDFSSHVVIAVFMGERPTGGYGITIGRILDEENEIIVNVKETYPGRVVVTGAFTFPHHIARVERAQKPIVFDVQQFLVHAYDENWNPYDEITYEFLGEHRVEAGSGPPEPPK
jgi:hypothetical protein